MYYRVDSYTENASNMFVLDQDSDLKKLKSRVRVDEGFGTRSFFKHKLIETQDISCVTRSGSPIKTFIIEENL